MLGRSPTVLRAPPLLPPQKLTHTRSTNLTEIQPFQDLDIIFLGSARKEVIMVQVEKVPCSRMLQGWLVWWKWKLLKLMLGAAGPAGSAVEAAWCGFSLVPAQEEMIAAWSGAVFKGKLQPLTLCSPFTSLELCGSGQHICKSNWLLSDGPVALFSRFLFLLGFSFDSLG